MCFWGKHFSAEYDITIIVFDSKLCLLYNRMEIDDEFQYLFNCTYRVVKDSRKKLKHLSSALNIVQMLLNFIQ